MNQIRRPVPESEEIARISEIVRRHPFPDFVVSFEVRLGDIEGDPAMWVVLKTTGGERHMDRAAAEERAGKLNALKRSIRADLLAEFDERFPYFRFEDAQEEELRKA